MPLRISLALLLAIGAVRALGADESAPPDYPKSIADARRERARELTKPDGWLTLIGLHFLEPGANTVGRGAGNRVVLAAGPETFGTVTLAEDGAVSFAAAPGLDVSADGQPATTAALRTGAPGRKPTLVASGTVSFFLIERGGRKALRVRDSAAERRTRFAGIDFFPVDPGWRIVADWVPFETPREIPITSIIGNVSHEKGTGKAVFVRDGRTFELLPVVEGPNDPLFFIFADATNGDETYGMRFLDAAPPHGGKVILDFNLAENPPCAFTPFATCPLPPKENRLPIRVTAGEKDYRGEHH